ncbi:MAG: hypothetical protein WDZ89_04870 [Gemmatimonadota bacterium]
MIFTSEVRAHLTRAAAPQNEYGTFLQQDLSVAVVGKLVGSSLDRLVLDIPSGDLEDGFQRQTFYRRVILNPEEIGAVEVRKLDRLKTGVLFGAIGTGLLILLLNSLEVIDPGGSPPTPPGGEL